MIRVVHMTTAHARNEVRVFLKECCSLASAGYEVHLLVADGLGAAVSGQVTIHDAGRVRGRFQRMLVLPWRMLLLARSLHARVYHFHEPELLLIALFLQLSGARVIYDSHEDVPRAILSREWIGLRLRRGVSRVFEAFENFTARRITGVIGATDHIAGRFAGINPRSVAINNFPLESEVDSDGARAPIDRTVCYVGAITRGRGIFEIMQALELADARLLLAGPFESEAVEAELRRLPGWQRVDYRGQVNRAEVRKIMAQAHAGLLFFHPEPNHVDAQPNKMFEYMSARLPVLASDFPLWTAILGETGAGLQGNPLDANAIAKLIGAVLADPQGARAMGERGRQAVQTTYRWQHEEAKLLRFYSGLLA